MPKFSRRSQTELMTCDHKLQMLFNEVIKNFNCTIIEGKRDQEKQDALYNSGKTKLKWPHSKHNVRAATELSRAVDVAPWPIEWDNMERFYYFAGFVKATAIQLRINIRWGGDWDDDTRLHDQSFDDLVHFELK